MVGPRCYVLHLHSFFSSTTINFSRRQADASLADMEGRETRRTDRKKNCLFNSRRKKTEKAYFFVGDREKRIFLHQQRKLTHLCTCVNALQRHPLPKKRSNQWHQHGYCRVAHDREGERKSSSPDLLFLLIINEIHFCFFFFEITGFFMC